MSKVLGFISVAIILVAQLATADVAAKYTGRISVGPNGPHGNGVAGALQIMFDGDTLKQIVLNTDKPVYGTSSFPSSEQTVFSETVGSSAEMVLVFKLVGPPHPWRYVLVAVTQDEGKTYPTGVIYSVNDTVDNIKAALDAGSVPSKWKKVGTANLTQVTN